MRNWFELPFPRKRIFYYTSEREREIQCISEKGKKISAMIMQSQLPSHPHLPPPLPGVKQPPPIWAPHPPNTAAKPPTNPPRPPPAPRLPGLLLFTFEGHRNEAKRVLRSFFEFDLRTGTLGDKFLLSWGDRKREASFILWFRGNELAKERMASKDSLKESFEVEEEFTVFESRIFQDLRGTDFEKLSLKHLLLPFDFRGW